GAHDSAWLIDILICNRGIDKICRDTSAGGTAHLNSLELLVVLDAAADIVDNFAESHSHGNLDQTALLDLAGKSEYLGTVGLLRALGREGFSAVGDDPRHVGVCLYVIDVGGKFPVTLGCRERRFQTRHTALAFQRRDQSCLLAAYECARAGFDADIKIKVCAEKILTQE